MYYLSSLNGISDHSLGKFTQFREVTPKATRIQNKRDMQTAHDEAHQKTSGMVFHGGMSPGWSLLICEKALTATRLLCDHAEVSSAPRP